MSPLLHDKLSRLYSEQERLTRSLDHINQEIVRCEAYQMHDVEPPQEEGCSLDIHI